MKQRAKPGGNGTLTDEKKPAGQEVRRSEDGKKEPDKKKNETKAEPAKADKTDQQTITNNQPKEAALEQEVKATPVASAIIADKKVESINNNSIRDWRKNFKG